MTQNHEGTFVILGKPLIGKTVYARTGGVDDPDGWQRNDEKFEWLLDGQPVTGASEDSFELPSEAANKYVSCRYSYTDAKGNRETVVSVPKKVNDPVFEAFVAIYFLIFDREPDDAGMAFYASLYRDRGIPLSKLVLDMEHNKAGGAS